MSVKQVRASANERSKRVTIFYILFYLILEAIALVHNSTHT
jgi:hypothetical protein